VTDLRLVHNDLKGAIEDAQYRYQILVDKRRTPVPKIEVGVRATGHKTPGESSVIL